MLSKRFKNLVIASLILAVLLGLAAVGFQHFYRRQLWDPLTMATVNGRALPISSLEEALNLSQIGLTMTEEGDGRQIMIRLLDRLIDEELIRQAAEKEGLKVDPAEVQANLALFRKPFGCDSDPDKFGCQAYSGSSGESLVKAVEKQLLLKAMNSLVSQREGHLSSTEWRIFFRNWLAKYSFSAVYRVRVLLAQEGEESEKILGAGKRGTLDELAEKIKATGLEVRVAGPMSLNLIAPETYKQFMANNLGPEMAKAAEQPDRLTGLLRFSASLAVFEVLEVVKTFEPEELVLAAKNEFERQVGERAFNDWLASLRREAVIELNPNLLVSVESGNFDGVIKPKLPWQGLLPWADDEPLEPDLSETLKNDWPGPVPNNMSPGQTPATEDDAPAEADRNLPADDSGPTADEVTTENPVAGI
ncbi:MAG: SurA N-terminal domain-containing protein [Deltaproteobacteria bacterium]|nr:SurA N-terminal domain-containing protein [Deltaproteobacteria bacterium]